MSLLAMAHEFYYIVVVEKEYEIRIVIQRYSLSRRCVVRYISSLGHVRMCINWWSMYCRVFGSPRDSPSEKKR